MTHSRQVNIFQAGTGEGSFSSGADCGPEALLAAGLVDQLHALGYQTSVLEAVTVTQNLPQDVAGVRESMHLIPWLQAVGQAMLSAPPDHLTLTLGGDHSVAIPSLLATKHRKPEAVCVYIDAHPDCHGIEGSPTGNLHGMPLTVATGETLADYFSGPYFRPSELCLVGIKDIDPPEAQWLAHHQVRHFTMDDIIARGIGAVMHDVAHWVGGRPLHVSYDIDAIDSQYAPGTGIINSGGLTYREASYIARHLAHEQLCAVDMVEVNPLQDSNNQTVLLAAELIVSLFGGRWDAYTRYLDHSPADRNHDD